MVYRKKTITDRTVIVGYIQYHIIEMRAEFGLQTITQLGAILQNSVPRTVVRFVIGLKKGNRCIFLSRFGELLQKALCRTSGLARELPRNPRNN